MNIIIRGSKLEITEAMEEYAKEKLSKLERYLDASENPSATVLVKIRGHLHKVEVTIPLKSLILRAEESQEDYYAAIDVVVDKLERQIRKNKTRIASNKKKEIRDFAYGYIEEMEAIEEEHEEKVVKRKKIDLKPMSEEEAILQMELLGHAFYLYKDADTDKPTVVYKRKDGDYGIIES
jgi:putative sigma-54 modulation protein